MLDLKLAVVLEGGQGVSGCSGHWQSGQKLNWHLGEEHSALWVCIRGLGEGDNLQCSADDAEMTGDDNKNGNKMTHCDR